MARPSLGKVPKAAKGDKLQARQNLGSPHSGRRTSITPGDSLDRMMGQYGKDGTPPPSDPGMNDPVMSGVALPPSGGGGGNSIRGMSGIRKRPTKGGFGGSLTPGVI